MQWLAVTSTSYAATLEHLHNPCGHDPNPPQEQKQLPAIVKHDVEEPGTGRLQWAPPPTTTTTNDEP